MTPKLRPDGRCMCGHYPQPEIKEPGYGMMKDGTTACMDCLTERQATALKATGAGRLYLTGNTVTNEAATLSFEVIKRSEAGHNIAASRADVWFLGPDGMRWQGTRYGEGDGPMRVKRCTGFQQLRDQLRAHGMTIYLNDGQYRVNFRHGKPETCYYTGDPVDAFTKALQMAEARDKPQPFDMSAFE